MREARPESAEERILQATIASLTRLDPAALTIQQICRAASVTAPTIYYHFGNKDGLIAAAVERLVTDWLTVLDATVSRGGSLEELVSQAIAVWEATITASTRPVAVFAWATLLLAESSAESRDALVRARDSSVALVSDALAPHLAETDELSELVVDVVLAAALQYQLDQDRAALRSRLQRLGRLVAEVAAQVPG